MVHSSRDTLPMPERQRIATCPNLACDSERQSFIYVRTACLYWCLLASAAGSRLQGTGHAGNSGLACVTATRQGTSSVSRVSQSSQRAQAIRAAGSGGQGNRGNNEHRDLSVCCPPAEQGCTQELKDWGETLSKDNVALASEVMQLRTMLAAEKENGCVLGDRVDKLQVCTSRAPCKTLAPSTHPCTTSLQLLHVCHILSLYRISTSSRLLTRTPCTPHASQP